MNEGRRFLECRTIISLILLVSLLFQVVGCASQSPKVLEQNEFEQGIQVVEHSSSEMSFVDEDGNEILYNSEEGILYYLYNESTVRSK